MATLIATPSRIIRSNETAPKGIFTAFQCLFEAVVPEWVAIKYLGRFDLSAGGTRTRLPVTTVWLGHV